MVRLTGKNAFCQFSHRLSVAWAVMLQQLSISDPLMMLPGDHTLAWYLGGENFPLQDLLEELFSKVVKIGGFKRVVFFGSSGGGFAALYYASVLPGSVAVPVHPQTSIQNYYSSHIEHYLNIAGHHSALMKPLKEYILI